MAAGSKRGLQERLTAKLGPLPVWAWAATILGAYLLYVRLHVDPTQQAASAVAPSSPATSGSDTAAQLPASGQGSPVDNLSGPLIDGLNANTSSLDALTSQLLSQYPYSFSYGDAPAAGSPVQTGSTGTPDVAPAARPTVQAPSPIAAGAPLAPHATQTQAGVLQWDGLTFTTKAAFNGWAASHGTSTKAIFLKHPQAKAIYSTLR